MDKDAERPLRPEQAFKAIEINFEISILGASIFLTQIQLYAGNLYNRYI